MQWAGAKGNGHGLIGSDWEQVVRQGVELAQGPTTEQFLQVVDLYPEHSLGQVIAASCLSAYPPTHHSFLLDLHIERK